MYPDTPYAEGRGSFLRPVPIPQRGPSAPPTKTVTVACEWLPYIRGALQQLLLQSTWATNNPAFLTDIQGNVANLIDLFSECSASDLPFVCNYDFTATDGAFAVVPESPDIPPFSGEYVAGGGWFDTISTFAAGFPSFRQILISKSFSPSVNMEYIRMTYDLNKGSFTYPPWENGIAGFYAGSQVLTTRISSISDPNGVDKTMVWAGAPTHIDTLYLFAVCSSNADGSDGGGSLNIKRLETNGVGAATC